MVVVDVAISDQHLISAHRVYAVLATPLYYVQALFLFVWSACQEFVTSSVLPYKDKSKTFILNIRISIIVCIGIIYSTH